MKGLFSKPITYVVMTLIGFVFSGVIIVSKSIKHPFKMNAKKNDKED